MPETQPRTDNFDLTDDYRKAPEYEAGVALVLWRAVVRAENGVPRNVTPRAYLLDTFAECLEATNGKRMVAHERETLQ